MNKVTEVKFSFPFLAILALMFIGFKLTNVIAWSWIWVLAPIWMPIAIYIVIMIVMLFFYVGLKK